MSDKALATLKQLTALLPNDAGVAANLGAAYAAHSQFEEAELSFDRALKLNPHSVSAMVGLANVDLKQERAGDAAVVLTRAIAIDSHEFEPFVLRARAYTRLKKYQEALGDFEKAIFLNGSDPDIRYYQAQAYRAMGHDAEAQAALSEFKRLREQSNEHIEKQRDVARMTAEAKRLAEAGDLQAAKNILEKALAAEPHNAPVLFRLAGLYYQDQQLQQAQTSIQEAVSLFPSQWDYRFLEGLIAEAAGDYEKAASSLQDAVRLNPSAAEAHNQLGTLAMRRNDFTEALAQFNEAARLQPAESIYQSNLEKAKAAQAQSASKSAGPQE
jgi:tetratricopeptide (TPR) repeat protein